MRGGAAAERKAGAARRVHHVFDPHRPGDRRTVIVARDRHVEQHPAVAGKHVAFPGNLHTHAVASAHEETVAGMRGGQRIVAVLRVVEELQRAFVASIAVVVEHAAVAAGEIHRLEDHAVGLAVHQPPRVTRSLVEIDHVALRCRQRIEREMHAARQAFVGADVVELLTVGEGATVGDDEFNPVGHPGSPAVREP